MIEELQIKQAIESQMKQAIESTLRAIQDKNNKQEV